jgi:hypothetical protein
LPILYTAAFAIISGANVAFALRRLPLLTALFSFHGLTRDHTELQRTAALFQRTSNHATLWLTGDNDDFKSNRSNRASCLRPVIK